MKNSLRFNPPKEWNLMTSGNRYYIGLSILIIDVLNTLSSKTNLKMLEIGSYKGESTFMFASSGIFDEIHCIDPHQGNEEANGIFNDSWEEIQKEFDYIEFECKERFLEIYDKEFDHRKHGKTILMIEHFCVRMSNTCHPLNLIVLHKGKKYVNFKMN